VDWASPDEDDAEGIVGEEPQALAAEPQAEAESQEAFEDKVMLPHRESEPQKGPYIHEEEGIVLFTHIKEDVLASMRVTTHLIVLVEPGYMIRL
jgi:hypothetical protein